MAELYPHIIRCTLLVFCIALLIAAPAHAFTAESLDITVDKNGDATATFRFTLEGLLENAIPQSMLEEQLVKGLSSSSDPPQLVSMDRSGATILMKKFALVNDVAQGTEYVTSSMDFKKAEIALQNSAVSSVITADFSPTTITVTFPDTYARTFNNVDTLPSVTHTVIDAAKAAAASAAATTGAIKVSSTPADTEVWIDGTYMGNAPSTFSDIPAGTHALRFQKTGYTPVTKNVNVTAGKTLQVSVFLAGSAIPTTKASASPHGSLVAGIALAGCVVLWSSRRQ